MHTVVETPEFIQDCKEANISERERIGIVDFIAKNPKTGDVIKDTGGARKVRFPGRGKGKSGGYRVITYYCGDDIPVFLLNIFAKGDKVNLTQAERNEMCKELSGLADEYRKGVRTYVQGR